MSIVEQTTPSTLPVTLEQARQHLNVTHQDDDQYIETLVRAATRQVEQHANVRLIRRQVRQYMDGWEDPRFTDNSTYTNRRAMRLELTPVSTSTTGNGTSVNYVDSSGTTQTLGTSVYAMTNTEPRAIYEQTSQSWPAVKVVKDNVYATYDVGYATTQREVPETFVHAIKLLIGHWYRNREAVEVGTVTKDIEWGIEALLGERRELYR